MKKLLFLLISILIFVVPVSVLAQTTVVPAVITDSDNFIWTSAQWSVTFVPNPSFPNTNQYSINGVSLTSSTYSSYLNQSGLTNASSGAFSVTLLDNTIIQPAGSNWAFTIKSNSSAPATVYQPIQIYGSTYNLTSFLSSNAVAPRFAATSGVFGYGDVELTTVPYPGGQYFNTTTLLPRFWNGTVWANYTGASGGVTSINGYAGTGTFSGPGVTGCSGSGGSFTCTFPNSGGGGGSFSLNNAELGAYSTGALTLTHTGHYSVPLAQTTTQVNALLATAPSGTFEFQNGDTVLNTFTNNYSSGAIAHIIHDQWFFVHQKINWDEAGVICDARVIPVTSMSTGSKTVTVALTQISSIDIGKVLWITQGQTTFQSQVVSVTDSLHFVVNSFPPFNVTSTNYAYLGTDNTTNAQNFINFMSNQQQLYGVSYGPPAKMTMSAGGCMTHTLNANGISAEGAGILTNLIFPDGEDGFLQPDAYTTPTTGGTSDFGNMAITIDGNIDATQAWTKVNDAGTTNYTANYRPSYVNTVDSNNPLSPQWIIGSGSNNSGAINGVASTNGTTVICVPVGSPYFPTVGLEIMFPYLSGGLLETTVSSTAGSCGGGASPFTLGASIPGTATQAEWFAGTNIQHTSVDFPAGRTYPFTLSLANSTNPSPALELMTAPYGLIQIGGEQCSYYGYTAISSYSITITGCTGSSIDHPSTSYVAPLNPFKPAYPFPVTPTINGGDTTPTIASFFPGHNIGNCAFAFPQSNGSSNSSTAWSQAHIHDIFIYQAGAYPAYNNTCAFYFVSEPYATHFNDIRISNTEYGIIQGMPAIENHNWFQGQPTADGTTWTGITIHAGYIFDFINANENNLSNFDTYSQLGNSSGTTVGCAGGFFITQGWDDQTGLPHGTMSAAITNNLYIEPENGSHCGTETLSEFDGENVEYHAMHQGGAGSAVIGGAEQHWFGGNVGTQSPNFPIINYGNGTTFDYTSNVGASPAGNTIGTNAFVNWGPKTRVLARTEGPGLGPYGSLVYGNNRTVWDGQTNETFNTGNLTAPYPYSASGLIDNSEYQTSAWDGAGAMTQLWTFDATAPITQSHVACNVGTSSSTAYCTPHAFNIYGIYIGPGQRLVNGQYILYGSFKSGLASNTFYFGLDALCSGSLNTVLALTPIAVTNAYPSTAAGTFQAKVDLSAYSDCTVEPIFAGATSADTIYTAFLDFAPLPENLQAAKLTIQGSGAPTIINTNGAETWQTGAPSTGCGTTWPNGTVWHDLAGTASGSSLVYICDTATTAWKGLVIP